MRHYLYCPECKRNYSARTSTTDKYRKKASAARRGKYARSADFECCGVPSFYRGSGEEGRDRWLKDSDVMPPGKKDAPSIDPSIDLLRADKIITEWMGEDKVMAKLEGARVSKNGVVRYSECAGALSHIVVAIGEFSQDHRFRKDFMLAVERLSEGLVKSSDRVSDTMGISPAIVAVALSEAIEKEKSYSEEQIFPPSHVFHALGEER